MPVPGRSCVRLASSPRDAQAGPPRARRRCDADDGDRQPHSRLLLRPRRHLGRGRGAGPGGPRHRVVAFVARVRAQHPDLVTSVDTWRASVGRAVAAEHDAALVCTHTGLPPRTRPHRVDYADVGASAVADTTASARRQVAAGVDPRSVLIEPPHDVGRTTAHSLAVTRRLGELTGTGWPVLVSLSHKDFVGETLDLPVGDRLTGTLAATAVCALVGARVYCVHEVTATRQVVVMVPPAAGRRTPARAVRGLA